MSAPAAAAPGAPALPAVPLEVTATISRTQTALDPLAPWALAAVLLCAAWALVRYRRGTRVAADVAVHGVGLARMAWVAALAVAGVALAWAVHVGPLPFVRAMDTWAAQGARAVTTPALRTLAVRFSDVGDIVALTLLTLTVTAVLLWRRRHWVATVWLLSITANSLAVRVLKNLFERARPDPVPGLVTSGYSFPSGHAAGALMVYGLLAWLLCQRASPRGRWLIGVAAALLIAAIAASRVLLGVHYLSDVLGGLLWAGMVLAVTVGMLQWARRAV
ncbi:phosphatase PAP2 family protein [Ottowia sp. SB7-C50]|uniref:phosphatase PAP2 family protein n=1 Tax=Ottowia sp. SB7-C50 TaxID=3081231 RepID=UPI002952ECE4|nr:phosphatase PAP2 family protein [Ottowia sp. SB7-C50]WOP15195.1 phosphatase PAP2 family protein [Ottowia sp. SB7-C50]